MAKIMIYEDSDRDLIYRYSKLNKNHNVSVCIVGPIADFMKEKYSSIPKKLEKKGFNLSQITGTRYANRIGNSVWESEYVEIPEADVYFLDGLGGDCLDLLERLPKDKSYLYTGDEEIELEAKRKGYQLVRTKKDLEEIIQKTLSK